jgi:hypothetical protein
MAVLSTLRHDCSEIEDLHQFFRRKTEDFALLCLLYGAQYYEDENYGLEAEARDSKTLHRHLDISQMNDVDFYTVSMVNPVPLCLDSLSQMDKALLTFNNCRESVFVLSDRVERRLKGNRIQVQMTKDYVLNIKIEVLEFEALFWMRGNPLPKIVLIYNKDDFDSGGDEIAQHDFLRIQAKGGPSFVVDFAA